MPFKIDFEAFPVYVVVFLFFAEVCCIMFTGEEKFGNIFWFRQITKNLRNGTGNRGERIEEIRNAFKVLVERLEKKRPLGGT